MKTKEDGTRGELPERLGQELSEKEMEVLKLVSQGFTYPEIAKITGKVLNTIKTKMIVIRQKLGGRNAPHSVAIAKDRGLI